jgi:hypothetical protein
MGLLRIRERETLVQGTTLRTVFREQNLWRGEKYFGDVGGNNEARYHPSG